MKKIIVLFAIILLYIPPLIAQHPMELKQESEHLAIIGKHGQEGIMLRWAPKSFALWQVASINGYVLERAEWDEENWPFDQSKLDYTLLASLAALPKDEWETRANINDPLVAVAAQGLYGNEATSTMPTANFADLRLKSEMQENRHAVAMFAADMSADAAFALGLSYYDKTVEAGKDYIYRLRTPGNQAGFGIDTTYIFMQYDGIPTPAPEVINISTSAENERIDIMWDKELNLQLFTAFYVERSEDGENFEVLNELPLTGAIGEDQSDALMYSDYDVTIGKKYMYRIIGIDPFAELGAASEAVEGIALDRKGPVPPTKVSIDQIDNTFSISWDIEPEMIVPDAMGWIVKRSLNATGPYQNLHNDVLPMRQKSFIDTDPIPIMTNYYRVYAVDTAYNETPGLIHAAVWVDSIPPVAPQNLRAVVDSLGIVSIYWDQNTEIDLRGYRVFVRDDKNKDWYQLTGKPIVENNYKDTVDLQSLSRSIEYTVIATDFHYNVSEYAEVFRLELPDLVPPSAPRWKPWHTKDEVVVLSWYPSSSSDVHYHRLLKKDADDWTILYDFTGVTAKAEDKISNTSFSHYALMAVDSAGNVSDTIFLKNIQHTYSEKLPGIENPSLQYVQETKSLEISWEYPTEEGIGFLVYRKDAQGSEATEYVGRFQGSTRQITDRADTSFTDGFDYFIKVVGDDGKESDWSQPLKVRFNL